MEVPQVSLLRPEILLGKANRVRPKNLRENREKKPQVSPLRYAPVEMTSLLQSWRRFSMGKSCLRATDLSSRPERTRISCYVPPDMATRAAFVKESRMKVANATKLNRKSGVAEWRDLRFLFPVLTQTP
jgi:hypothetical protein